MEISNYQGAIIDWVRGGTGHGCCRAVAGSGKSTTLRLAALALQQSGLSPWDIKICVFGRANAQELSTKFGQDWQSSISTLHSAGWTLIKQHLGNNFQPQIKANKYKFIAQDLGYISKKGQRGKLKFQCSITKEDSLLTLIDLVRLTDSELDSENLKEICNHFEISDIWDFGEVSEAIAEILDEGEFQAHKGKCCDFTDQIWLPVKWDIKPTRPYKFVLVDECQDLNACQLQLVLSLAGENGRILAVGDDRQAIMGFAGADNRSYHKIVDRLQAKELPLSICYRCPILHIDLVKLIFPEIPIESRGGAPQGKIKSIDENDLWEGQKPSRLREGDMVISRKTAPLVSLCIRLIARGIAATVKGRAIGEQIKGDLREIEKMPGFTYARFNEALTAYRNAKELRYRELDNEEQLVENLRDKLQALGTIYTSQPQASSVAQLEAYTDSFFSDETSPITLSTCHRAKGLEAERVFIIKPNDLPMSWRNQQDWQKEQENNLLYVALTRSKIELYIVGNPPWLEDADTPKTDNALTPIQKKILELSQSLSHSEIEKIIDILKGKIYPPEL